MGGEEWAIPSPESLWATFCYLGLDESSEYYGSRSLKKVLFKLWQRKGACGHENANQHLSSQTLKMRFCLRTALPAYVDSLESHRPIVPQAVVLTLPDVPQSNRLFPNLKVSVWALPVVLM